MRVQLLSLSLYWRSAQLPRPSSTGELQQEDGEGHSSREVPGGEQGSDRLEEKEILGLAAKQDNKITPSSKTVIYP